MSWNDQAQAMINHGATKGGIFSHAGDAWGQVGMDKVSKQELGTLANNIRAGKWEMALMGKRCIVMSCIPGHSITGKTKGESEEDERPLWHAVLGKSNCLYVAGCQGANERGVVDILENKFSYLKEY